MDWNTHHPLSRKKTGTMTQAFGFGRRLILPNHTSGRDTLRHYWPRQFRGVTKRSQTRPCEMHKILCIRGSALWEARGGMVMSELELHVHDEQIIVNMPETRLTMTYQASSDAPWLIELPFWTCDDRTAPISVNDFRGGLGRQLTRRPAS